MEGSATDIPGFRLFCRLSSVHSGTHAQRPHTEVSVSVPVSAYGELTGKHKHNNNNNNNNKKQNQKADKTRVAQTMRPIRFDPLH